MLPSHWLIGWPVGIACVHKGLISAAILVLDKELRAVAPEKIRNHQCNWFRDSNSVIKSVTFAQPARRLNYLPFYQLRWPADGVMAVFSDRPELSEESRC